MKKLFLTCLLLLPTVLLAMEKDEPQILPNEILSNVWQQFAGDNYEELQPNFYESIALTSKNQYTEYLNIYKKRLVNFLYEVIVECDKFALLAVQQEKQVKAYSNLNEIVASKFENMDKTVVNELTKDEIKRNKFVSQILFDEMQKVVNFNLANTINKPAIEALLFKEKITSFNQAFKIAQEFLDISLDKIYKKLAINYDANPEFTSLSLQGILPLPIKVILSQALVSSIIEHTCCKDEYSDAGEFINNRINDNKNNLHHLYRLFKKLMIISSNCLTQENVPFISNLIIQSKEIEYAKRILKSPSEQKKLFFKFCILWLVNTIIAKAKNVSSLDQVKLLTDNPNNIFSGIIKYFTQPILSTHNIINKYGISRNEDIEYQYNDQKFVKDWLDMLLKFKLLVSTLDDEILSLLIDYFPSVKDKIRRIINPEPKQVLILKNSRNQDSKRRNCAIQ